MTTRREYSISKIQNLKPSDIQYIQENVRTAEDIGPILECYLAFLNAIIKPNSSDIDDVIKVSAQLKTARLWEKIDLDALLSTMTHFVNYQIVEAVRPYLVKGDEIIVFGGKEILNLIIRRGEKVQRFSF